MRLFFIAATFVLAAPAFAAGATSASFGVTFVDADKGGPIAGNLQQTSIAGAGVIDLTGNQGPGTANNVKVQSSPWLNKLGIASDASAGFVYGAGTSVWAVNQTVTGTPGTTARLTYDFRLTGNFAPGPADQYLPPEIAAPQNFTYYFLAYRGVAQGFTALSDANGSYILFESTAGDITLIKSPNSPGYINTLQPQFIGRAACFGADTRCSAGGSFDDRLSMSFDMDVGENYFIVGFMSSQTSGQSDFYHTARLLTIDLAPEFGLLTDDGGILNRNANGTFGLSVPEPASWAMLITGFGLVGAMQRRRRPLPA
ncbi:PEPxxWA-CTERM sorting domain-containing protein [Sandarakinorhabdus sp. AAP62]|uniref:PEPxxWA-CTERM sorting domain-containing protein n=1 Tax=Sandarakinorhabdus sp. AAP62 TaxID=1248916 RepID=UPI000310225F|nr:PEPxxWA-CTERM sorting domain-containing protein [Sandarakinorhabdus sp. AAP62]